MMLRSLLYLALWGLQSTAIILSLTAFLWDALSWCSCLCFTYQQSANDLSKVFRQESGSSGPQFHRRSAVPCFVPFGCSSRAQGRWEVGELALGTLCRGSPCPPPPQTHTEPSNLEAPPHLTSSLLLSPPWLPWSPALVASSTVEPEPSRLGWGAAAHSPQTLRLQDSSAHTL